MKATMAMALPATRPTDRPEAGDGTPAGMPAQRQLDEWSYVRRLKSHVISAADKLAWLSLWEWTDHGRQIVLVSGTDVGEDQNTTRGKNRIDNLLAAGLVSELPFREETGPRKGIYKLKLLTGRTLFDRLNVRLAKGTADPQHFFAWYDAVQATLDASIDDGTDTLGPADVAGGQAPQEAGVLRLISPCASTRDADGHRGSGVTAAAPDGQRLTPPLAARAGIPAGVPPPQKCAAAAVVPAELHAEPPAEVLAKLREPRPAGGDQPPDGALTLNTSSSLVINSTSHFGSHLPSPECQVLPSLAVGAGAVVIGATGSSAALTPSESREVAALNRLVRERRAEPQHAAGAPAAGCATLGERVEALLDKHYSPAAHSERVGQLVVRWFEEIRDHRMYRARLASLAWDVVEGRIPLRAVEDLLSDMRKKAKCRSAFFNGGIDRLRHRYEVSASPKKAGG
jgi:hypothetical protein